MNLNDIPTEFTISKVKFDKNTQWSRQMAINKEKPLFDLQKNPLISKNDVGIKRDGKLYTKHAEGEFQFYPSFEKISIKNFNSIKLEVTIREISTESDWNNYLNLQKFHYLSNDGFPREVTLVATINEFAEEIFIGYVTITIPSYMNKARHNVLAKPYKNEEKNIEWNEWNASATKENVNRIVNISRILVHPEYRNLGISTILIDSAKEFCNTRWHVKGLRPIFVEITASLLLYSPFPAKSNMVFAGNTLGNISRIFRDIRYAQKKAIPKETPSGIKAFQSKYVSSFAKNCEEHNLTVEEGLKLLEKMTYADYFGEHYEFYKDLVRLPKGVYLGGLDEVSVDYLKEYKRGSVTVGREDTNISIRFNEIGISYQWNRTLSKNIKLMHETFGNPNDELKEHVVLENFSDTLRQGDIVAIGGQSGSGKSSILNLISGRTPLSSGSIISGLGEMIDMRDIKFGDKPIIDEFDIEFEKIIKVFNKVGLLDPSTYIKTYSNLSKGQKFRVMLARLLVSNKKIWLIDEFCTGVDPFTTNIIIKNVKWIVAELGIILIVATPTPSIIKKLAPTKVYWKRLNPEIKIFKSMMLFNAYLRNSIYT